MWGRLTSRLRRVIRWIANVVFGPEGIPCCWALPRWNSLLSGGGPDRNQRLVPEEWAVADSTPPPTKLCISKNQHCTRKFANGHHRLRAAQAIQRHGRHPPRRPHHPAGGGQRLVSRRLQERGNGPHRLRPPVRARDVRGHQAPPAQPLRAAAEGRGQPERLHHHRPHQLLGGRAFQLPGAGPVAGGRPHGLPAGRPGPAEVRRAARRGEERAPPVLREPSPTAWPTIICSRPCSRCPIPTTG